ncbi:hypothetical protein D3C87_1326790 [compost metagenome]
MKLKAMIAAAATLVVFGASQGMAQDEANVVFSCESLPTADSALNVIGVADEQTGEVDVLVYIAGHLMAQDKGAFVEGTTTFEGAVFTMEFDHISKIIAKAENNVLSIGQADSLICQYPGLK